MNLPKRAEIKYKNDLRRANPRSESLMEQALFEELIKLGLRFQKQFPIGPFFADLAHPEVMMVVEYDGKEFHNEEKDAERDAFMRKNGWMVLRVWSVAGLFFLGKDNVADSLKKIAEEIDDIFEQRRYQFRYDRKYESADQQGFTGIKNELANVFERITRS